MKPNKLVRVNMDFTTEQLAVILDALELAKKGRFDKNELMVIEDLIATLDETLEPAWQ